MRRILAGSVMLLLIAVLVIIVSLVRFDLPREALIGKYANEASRFVTLPGGASVHMRDEGKADGPVLMLLHGSNASLHTWEPWVKRLGDEWRIITLDLPGHGLTGRVPGDDYSPAGMVRVVHELAEHMGLEHFALAGSSMGGRVVTLYAAEYPDQVKAVVLVNAAGIPIPQDDKAGPLAFRLARMPVVGQLMGYTLSRSLVAEGIRKIFADPSLATEEMISRYYDLLLHDGNRYATRLRFQSYDAEREKALADRISEIKAPTLIIWGDKDVVVPVSAAYAFSKRLPQAEMVIFPDVGHVPMEEVPDESAKAVRDFLSRIQSSEGMPVPSAIEN